MSIHTKSLNQLAQEVEAPSEHGGPMVIRAKSAADIGVDSSVADALKGLLPVFPEIAPIKSSAELALTAATANTTAREATPGTPQRDSGSAGDFIAKLEGGFGLRNRGEDRAALRHAEASVRLYQGFASRADVTGEK